MNTRIAEISAARGTTIGLGRPSSCAGFTACSAAALAAVLMLGCGGGGNSTTPSAERAQGPVATVSPQPGTVATPTAGGASEPTLTPLAPELAGTWSYVGNNSQENSSYEFHRDGTFTFYSLFSYFGEIRIVERGRYRTDGQRLIVAPETKLYNDEPDTPSVPRAYEWQVQPDVDRGEGRLLTLVPEGGGILNPYHGS